MIIMYRKLRENAEYKERDLSLWKDSFLLTTTAVE